ncbi:MAG: peptidoglycan recognition family protein [Verrucomicrobiales bacterium]|nr:peptidoglycan recognition family protein [Verrucomicrobiales bacterium]
MVILFAIAGLLLWIAWPVLFGTSPRPEETKWPENLYFISRSEWADQSISHPEDIEPMSGITRVTIHHDGMPPLPMKTEAQIKSRIVSIRKSHSKKYADIGYHYIVDPRGRIWEGRPLQYQGAHVQGHNSNNVGILFLGNTYKDIPTAEGLDGLFTFIRYLKQRYKIPAENVKTHRELAQTGCPGKLLQEELDKARKSGKLKVRVSPGFRIDIEDWIRKLETWIGEAKKLIEA